MSRVYNALTGVPRPAGAATLDPPDDGAWENTDDAPFVEVGGPGGPVFSHAPAPAPRPAADAKPEPKPEPARTFPRLAPPPGSPAYLSVRFHDLTDTARPKPSPDGPDPDLVVLHYPDHPISGEYRVLRDEIRTQLPEPTPKVLVFTAAAPEAGTTTVLLNLGIAIAHEGGPRVLVVDAHVNRPAAARKLALKPAPGLLSTEGVVPACPSLPAIR